MNQKSDKYLVNIRFALPRPRFFFVFVIGRDRRSMPSESDAERRYRSSLRAVFFFLTALLWATVALLALSFLFLYLFKSHLGIDLVQGSSPFPAFLKRVGICH